MVTASRLGTMRTTSPPAARADANAPATLLELCVRFGLRRPIALGIHTALAVCAFTLAFELRYDFSVPHGAVRLLAASLPYLLLLRAICLGQLGVYRGSWRHVGLSDLASLTIATTASTLLFVVVLFALGELRGMPRSVLLLDWLLFIFLAGGARFGARYLRETSFRQRGSGALRTLVIGAGEAAEHFLRQTMHDGRTTMKFVGLLDDDMKTHGLSLHGVPVLGAIQDLATISRQRAIELLIIAIPSATGEQIRRVVTLCARTGIEFKILPSLDELLDGRVQIGQVRDVQIEDLLGRDPVHLDLAPVERDLAWKTVLVTGAAGSIGSELARQVATFGPARLILLEQAESPLYFVHLELARAYPALEVVPVIGDVTDSARVDSVFARFRPDYVFHAAAYKHVPMMEANVVEAVRNNVMGTLRVAECAARHRAEKFVLISTDKAVNPSSVMGATKRLAELIVLGCSSLRASKTDFRAVRFGNVLGSDGSVVPLFKRQIAAGGPLTVTHPDVTRYFMSIPEAVQLVLQASAIPEARRRITMLDMGAPVRIVDLAEQLIRLSGLVPHRDIPIVFTGLRPGEKLDEELMSLIEDSIPTTVDKIRIVETGSLPPGELEASLQRLREALVMGDAGDLIHELRVVIPEYTPRYRDREVTLPWHREVEHAHDGQPVSAPLRSPFELGGVVARERSPGFSPEPPSTVREAPHLM